MSEHDRSKARPVPGDDFLDFNNVDPTPIAARAAAAVALEDLRTLFERLEGIDKTLETETADQRQAALDALSAVVEFLARSRFNTHNHFFRIFTLLFAELKNSPAPKAGEIIARRDPEMGASTRKNIEHYIMASAAFAADMMHAAHVPLNNAYLQIARLLEAHRFPFGTARGTTQKRAEAIQAWRKGQTAAAVQEYYKSLKAEMLPPINSEQSAEWVLQWLANQLIQAGYEAS